MMIPIQYLRLRDTLDTVDGLNTASFQGDKGQIGTIWTIELDLDTRIFELIRWQRAETPEQTFKMTRLARKCVPMEYVRHFEPVESEQSNPNETEATSWQEDPPNPSAPKSKPRKPKKARSSARSTESTTT